MVENRPNHKPFNAATHSPKEKSRDPAFDLLNYFYVFEIDRH